MGTSTEGQQMLRRIMLLLLVVALVFTHASPSYASMDVKRLYQWRNESLGEVGKFYCLTIPGASVGEVGFIIDTSKVPGTLSHLEARVYTQNASPNPIGFPAREFRQSEIYITKKEITVPQKSFYAIFEADMPLLVVLTGGKGRVVINLADESGDRSPQVSCTGDGDEEDLPLGDDPDKEKAKKEAYNNILPFSRSRIHQRINLPVPFLNQLNLPSFQQLPTKTRVRVRGR